MNKPRFLGKGESVEQLDCLVWIVFSCVTVPHCIPYSGIADLSNSISVNQVAEIGRNVFVGVVDPFA